MKDFFTEADCDGEITIKHIGNQLGGSRDYVRGISLETANRLIRERSKVVYGAYDGNTFSVPDPRLGLRSGTSTPDTHRALLICVEEIEKEDTAEELLREILASMWMNCNDREYWIERARKLLKGCE